MQAMALWRGDVRREERQRSADVELDVGEVPVEDSRGPKSLKISNDGQPGTQGGPRPRPAAAATAATGAAGTGQGARHQRPQATGPGHATEAAAGEGPGQAAAEEGQPEAQAPVQSQPQPEATAGQAPGQQVALVLGRSELEASREAQPLGTSRLLGLPQPKAAQQRAKETPPAPTPA